MVGEDHAGDSRIYDDPFAEQAGKDLGNRLARFDFDTHQVKVAPGHVEPGCMNYGVHFGVNGPAEFIVLPWRNIFFHPDAVANVDAVRRLPRGAVIAGADDLVVFDDHGAEPSPQAGAPHGYGFCYFDVVLALGRSVQFFPHH